MTIPCLLRGTNIDALHNPIVRTSIMSEFLAKKLLGNMQLVPTDKLFKSPLGLFFECCGIARDVPIIIDKIEVFLDFHIFAILEFDLLIGHPLENLIQEKPSHGGLDERLGTFASATSILCLESPKAKQHPNHDVFEEAKFIPHLFHLGFLVKPFVPRQPHSNQNHVPLAIKTLFSIMVENQP
jgi:hypothetical protein